MPDVSKDCGIASCRVTLLWAWHEMFKCGWQTQDGKDEHYPGVLRPCELKTCMETIDASNWELVREALKSRTSGPVYN